MQFVRRSWRGKALAVLVAALLTAAACGSDSKTTSSPASSTGATKKAVIKFGVDESLTGPFVAFAIPPADAVKLAVKEINDAGGFTVGDTTYTIELTVLDDRSDGAAAVANVTQLVQDDGIKFIFGPTTSSLANQTADITVANEAIQLSAAGSWQSNGNLKDPNKPLLFGTQVPLDVLAKNQADGIAKLGGDTIGILSQDDDTSKGNVPPVVAALEAQGKKVLDVRFPKETTDFTSFLTQMKANGMDTLFYFFPQARAAEAINLAIQLGAAPMGFSTRNVDPAVAISGATGSPLPLPFHSLQGTPSFQYPPNDGVKKVADAMKALDPNMPLTGANSTFYQYDFVKMLVKAMQKAGTVEDTAAIADALKTVVYDGAAGKVCFAKDQRTAIYDTGQIFVRDGKVESTTTAGAC
jgi:ABC-type branched-subunit amino acid transport system substrate-binding protein